MALFARDFFESAKARRFFWLRSLTVLGVMGIPCLLTMTMARSTASGEALFTLLSFAMIAGIVFLTPFVIAPALCEERRNRKLEVLRSTPINERTIILALLLSRILLVALIMVATLPLLAVALLFGGVGVATFFQTLLILFSALLLFGAFAHFAGAGSATIGQSISRSSATILLTLVVTTIVVANADVSWRPGDPFDWKAVLIGVINPFVSLWHIMAPFSLRTPTPAPSLPLTSPSHLASHAGLSIVFALVFVGLSIRRLAREGEDAKEPKQRPNPNPSLPKSVVARLSPAPHRLQSARHARRLWSSPLDWLESRQRRARTKARMVFLYTGLILLILDVFTFLLPALQDQPAKRSFYENVLLPQLVLTSLGMLIVAANGVRCFHPDEASKTSEVLNSTPVTTREIVSAKLRNAFRPVWWILGLSLLHALVSLTFDDRVRKLAGFALPVITLVQCWAVTTRSVQISLNSKRVATASFSAFGNLVLWYLIVPIIVLLAVVRSMDSHAILAFVGYHPVTQAVVLSETSRKSEVAIVIAYMIGMSILAFIRARNFIPSLYDEIRQGVSRRHHATENPR